MPSRSKAQIVYEYVVGPVGGHIGLQAKHVTAHVEWVAIYSTAE